MKGSPYPVGDGLLMKMVSQQNHHHHHHHHPQSRIVLVDLAGSERIGRSLVEGKMKEEAISINMSLTYVSAGFDYLFWLRSTKKTLICLRGDQHCLVPLILL